MSDEDIKKLIIMIENKLKEDDRFYSNGDDQYRKHMKKIYRENKNKSNGLKNIAQLSDKVNIIEQHNNMQHQLQHYHLQQQQQQQQYQLLQLQLQQQQLQMQQQLQLQQGLMQPAQPSPQPAPQYIMPPAPQPAPQPAPMPSTGENEDNINKKIEQLRKTIEECNDTLNKIIG